MGNWKSLNRCSDKDQDSYDSSHLIHNNVLTNFPDSLLQELIQYLSEFEIIEFSQGNKDLRNRLQKTITIIRIKNRSHKQFLDYPCAASFNENYYSTFNISRYYLHERLHLSSLPPYPLLKFLIVQCTTAHLPLLIEYKVKYIHDLQVSFEEDTSSYGEAKNDNIVLLSNAFYESDLIVHKLSLFNVGSVVLPVFERVVSLKINTCKYWTREEMNIHHNSSLRHLELLSSSISFFSSQSNLPFSLLSLSISSCLSITNIPQNNLRYLTISNCSMFSSLANMSHIKSVTLSRLRISSLNGLGSGNKFITIIDCNNINDWSAVRKNKFVRFRTTFTTIRPFYLHLAMKDITHLQTVSSSLPNLANAKRLKEMIIDGPVSVDRVFWRLIETMNHLPSLQRVIFKSIDKSKIQSDGQLETLLSKSRFSAHYGPRQLVLSR